MTIQDQSYDAGYRAGRDGRKNTISECPVFKVLLRDVSDHEAGSLAVAWHEGYFDAKTLTENRVECE